MLDVRGLHHGGVLGPGRFLFRGQLFWQELLPDQVATNQLEFKIGMGDDKRNFARIPNDIYSSVELLPHDDVRLIQAAVCVPEGREDETEVTAVLRATASWGDCIKLRRLLASCFAPPESCTGALCEAAGRGYEEVVQEL